MWRVYAPCTTTVKAQDIAEDVMREAIEAMGVSGFQERLYGKVDYKKAIYVFVPEAQTSGAHVRRESGEGQRDGNDPNVADVDARPLPW